MNTRIKRLIKKTKKEELAVMQDQEMEQLCLLVSSVDKIDGDIAEVGVYRGGSARLICEVKGNKRLHLFDTFLGLPELSEYDNKDKFTAGKYSAKMAEVIKYLSPCANVYFHKGLFPQSGHSVRDLSFSFVHLDVDLYKSTYDSLDFFYPRMSKGGIILTHDYSYAEGVKKAFDMFFANKIEPIIPFLGEQTQAIIVKL